MENTFGNSGMFTLNEFNNRGVIKLAPDALVYIAGSLVTSVIAPVDNKEYNLSFDDGISTISVQNNVDPPGSSTASIEVITPIYGENSRYWTSFQTPEGNMVRLPVFVPMMEVKIFFKGRFFVKDKPRYYPAFWGFIQSVEENYSGGTYKINIQCVDILHWWSYSTVNVHPLPADNVIAGGNLNLTAYSTIFKNANPFSIMKRLVETMGMSDFVYPTWVAQSTQRESIYPSDLFKRAAMGITSYWRIRFKNIANLLKMYGLQGEVVYDGGLSTRQPEDEKVQKQTNSDALKATASTDFRQYKINTDLIRRFTPFFEYTKMGDFEQSEYMTKLEIATELKTRIDYEFFQDVNGNFIFKPPFYNLDVKNVYPYVIKPRDVINYSLNTDTEGIVTVLQVHTAMAEHLYTTSFAKGIGFHMDIELAKRYGVRFQEITLQYITDKRIAKSMALGHMSMINSKTVTGSVTIPGRPEMKLGYPIYLEHRDSYHYTKSINHSFDYAGSFSTTLSYETERPRVYEFRGSDYAHEPHAWGSVMKSKIYRFAENILPKPSETDAQTINPDQLYDRTEDELKEDNVLRNSERVVSLQQGRYKLDDMDRVKGEESLEQMSATDYTVPFTDKDGYRVIGSFPYGRGLDARCIDSNVELRPEDFVTNIAAGSGEESQQMSKLFFSDKEGAVPLYLDQIGKNSLIKEVAIEQPQQPGILQNAEPAVIATPENIGPTTIVPSIETKTSNTTNSPLANNQKVE